MAFKMQGSLVSLAEGIADGYLGWQDITWAGKQLAANPSATLPPKNRSNDQLRQWSTWLELAGLGTGFWLNRTGRRQEMADALAYTSFGLLGKRAGNYVGAQAMNPKATATAPGLPLSSTVGAPAVFPGRGAPQYDTAAGRQHAGMITGHAI